MKVLVFIMVCFFVLIGQNNAQLIDGGAGHSLIVCSNGEVYACGENSYGQIGDVNIDTTWVFSKVPNLMDIIAVSAGAWHSLALSSTGKVWGWGGNDNGQLVDGSVSNKFSPVVNDSLKDVVQVSAGWWHTLFLLKDSTVYGGGSNSNGELGMAPPPYSLLNPNKIPGLSKVIKVAGGYDYSMVLRDDGTVIAFGLNGRGQLGNGTLNSSSVPTTVSLNDSIVDIAVGWSSSYAISANGDLWAWGSNRVGQLGTGAPVGNSEYSSLPVKVSIDSVVMIRTENYSTLALRQDGTVWAWGSNASGQLGNGTQNDENLPVRVQGLDSIVEVGMASGVGLAIDVNGNVYSWGGVGFTLGNGINVSKKLIPSPISPISCNPIISLTEQAAQKPLVEIYPNPVNEFIVIELGKGKRLESVEVFSSTGVSVMKRLKPERSIDISGLSKGIFILKIEVDGQFMVKKILKE